MMQQILLAVMRFCLSAWVGMAIFFFTVVIDVLDSVMTDRLSKYNHPEIFLPPYFGFVFALLGTGCLCAFLGLWNVRISLFRKYITLAFVLAALGMAAIDYATVYRKIAGLLANPTAIPAAQFVMLYRHSRLLKGAVLALSLVAAIQALWPVRSVGTENPQSKLPRR